MSVQTDLNRQKCASCGKLVATKTEERRMWCAECSMTGKDVSIMGQKTFDEVI